MLPTALEDSENPSKNIGKFMSVKSWLDVIFGNVTIKKKTHKGF